MNIYREVSASCLSSFACHCRESQLLVESARKQIRESSHQLFWRLMYKNYHLQLRDNNELMGIFGYVAAQAFMEIAGVWLHCRSTCIHLFFLRMISDKDGFVQRISLQLHWLLLNTFFPLVGCKCGQCCFQLSMRQA